MIPPNQHHTQLSLWRGEISRPRPLTLARIVRQVADETGVPVADILGPSRIADISSARHTAMARARAIERPDGSPRYSLPMIGRVFNRDHTTVLYAVRKMADA